MAIYVQTNMPKLNGLRHLDNVHKEMDVNYQRLSSGLRINSAKDDAAGLQISDRLTTQINGLNQGNRNASDAIAFVQTVDGGLDEVTNMLQRIRTLAVQASNGTNTQEDHEALKKEAKALSAEISRIATDTTYAGKTILSGYQTDSIYTQVNNQAAGTTGHITFHVGANAGDAISLSVESFVLSTVVCKIDDDIGTEATDNSGYMIDKLDNNNSLARLSISSIEQAKSAISLIDNIIAKVDGQRSDLGAMQNRLESSIRNQSNVSANQADARSRISDADYAEETSNLAVQGIREQSANAMLIHANSTPKLAATLLNLR